MTAELTEYAHILRHPEDGFNNIHVNKTGSVRMSLIIGILWFISELLSQQYTGFRFNTYNKTSINILYIFLGTFVLFLLFAISNWAICTLFDGEGSFREILIVCGYCLMPYVVTKYLSIALSYVFNINEGIFISILMCIGFFYSLFLLCVGLTEIHNYAFLRMAASLIATVIGICLILALLFLMVTLFQQLFSFIYSIFDEIMMRGLR